MSDTINCRSRKSKSCYHGQPVERVYPDGIDDDSTWDGESVVCDPCYMAIGQPGVPVNAPGARDYPATIEGGKGRVTYEQRLMSISESDYKALCVLVDRTYGMRRVLEEAWAGAITEEQATRLATLAENWLDEHRDVRDDADVAKLRAAFRS